MYKQKILELLKQGNLSIEEISEQLGVEGLDPVLQLNNSLNELEEEGLILYSKNHRFYLPESSGLIRGILKMNKRGFGFVDGEDQSYFISPVDLKRALHLDEVFISLINSSSNKEKKEAKVERVIKHTFRPLVGLLTINKGVGFVKLDDRLYNIEVVVNQKHLKGAIDGHKVLVEVLHPLKKEGQFEGRVTEIIGHKNDPGIDILSIVYKNGFNPHFSQEALNQAESISTEISDEDKAKRTDLTSRTIVTIDGEDAKDLDDAVDIERLENGHYRLGVHIADVSHYVTENSPLDQEAFDRSTSVYLVDRVVPMIPHRLSNGICSLNPQVERLTISCDMEINQQGKVVNYNIYPSFIKTTERMTYTAVNEILEKNIVVKAQYAHLGNMFETMMELALILRDMRHRRGAIDFDVEEGKVIVDENSKPIAIEIRERKDAEKLIEDFMLIANETVAGHIRWQQLPFIYRIHETPDPKKIRQFLAFASVMGYKLKGSVEHLKPMDVQHLLEEAKKNPDYPIIATTMLRSMAKARYYQECIGHFGLAAQNYTHFTSPIRRYPDLIVHRLLHTYMFEQDLSQPTVSHFEHRMPIIAEQTSKKERDAIEAEREVDDMKKCEFMIDHVGETFDGIISNVTSFGMFIQLPNTIEGLIHVSDLRDDFYVFDPTHYSLRAQRKNKVYRIGDRVRVVCMKVNVDEREIDFAFEGTTVNNYVSRKPKKYPPSQHTNKTKAGLPPKGKPSFKGKKQPSRRTK